MSFEVIRGYVSEVGKAREAKSGRGTERFNVSVRDTEGQIRNLESVELFGSLGERLSTGASVVLVRHWDRRGRGRLVAGHVDGETEVHRFPAEFLGGWGIGICALLLSLGAVTTGWLGALLAVALAVPTGLPLVLVGQREVQVKFETYRILREEGLLGSEESISGSQQQRA
ncbi:hypothetical protein [Halorhodospira halophila]|uniref:Uncharacterized protein n=1 Tax=Halorhodospira halophila (strain DSM 244 / SL1) TaxID=349124 RepID=A1WWM4_HALHL|nr:hypothetical protein [Halorhodospira halophila]ABM62086.1 hypothetical protein Hhal_1319 [Halorhodospira halophila SL1]MBK1729414.1 hypothetical protein [Halorhodospira halophila]